MSSHFEIFQLTLIWQDTTEKVTGYIQYHEKLLLKTRELTTGHKFKSFNLTHDRESSKVFRTKLTLSIQVKFKNLQ